MARPRRHPVPARGPYERRQVRQQHAVEARRQTQRTMEGQGEAPQRPTRDHLEGEDGRQGMEGDRRGPVALGESREGPGHAATRAGQVEDAAQQADRIRTSPLGVQDVEDGEPGDADQAGRQPVTGEPSVVGKRRQHGHAAHEEDPDQCQGRRRCSDDAQDQSRLGESVAGRRRGPRLDRFQLLLPRYQAMGPMSPQQMTPRIPKTSDMIAVVLADCCCGNS